MTHETLELIERARRRLKERDLPCAVAGAVSEEAIAAAEEALGCVFPGSYRAFLRRFGALSLPHRLSTIHQFVGLDPRAPATAANDTAALDPGGKGVVERTLHARVENRLPRSLVIVGLGTEAGEWFCLDIDRARPDGECPIYLFDARDNALDQQFYDDFGAMLDEVVSFVLENLDEDEGLAAPPEDAGETSDETSLGGVF